MAIRVLIALLLILCGIAPAIFLLLLFGPNSRTVTVAIWPLAAAILVACFVDRTLREAKATPDLNSNLYAKRLKAVMIAAAVALGCSVLILLGLVGLAATRSLM